MVGRGFTTGRIRVWFDVGVVIHSSNIVLELPEGLSCLFRDIVDLLSLRGEISLFTLHGDEENHSDAPKSVCIDEDLCESTSFH